MSPEILHKPLPAAVVKEEEVPPPILPTLIDWTYIPGLNIISAQEVLDHPRLGSYRARPGDSILTSSLLWLNRETRMAQTKNTTYRLEREVK